MTSFTDLLSMLPGQRLGWTLLHSLWQFSVIGFFVWEILALSCSGGRQTSAISSLALPLLAMLAGSVATFQMLHDAAGTNRPVSSANASSAESMGEFWFGEVSKLVI